MTSSGGVAGSDRLRGLPVLEGDADRLQFGRRSRRSAVVVEQRRIGSDVVEDAQAAHALQPAQFQLAAEQEFEGFQVAARLGHVAAPGVQAVAVDQVAPQRLAVEQRVDLGRQRRHVLGVGEAPARRPPFRGWCCRRRPSAVRSPPGGCGLGRHTGARRWSAPANGCAARSRSPGTGGTAGCAAGSRRTGDGRCRRPCRRSRPP